MEDRRNLFKGIFAAGAVAAVIYFFFDIGSFFGEGFSLYDIFSTGADDTEMLLYFWCPTILAGLSLMFMLANRKEGYAIGIVAIIAFVVSDIYIASELEEMPDSMFLNIAGLVAMAVGVYKLQKPGTLKKSVNEDKGDKKDETPPQVTCVEDETPPQVTCVLGELAGAAIPLDEKLVIGKDPQRCNLIVSADTCSRIHCEIMFNKEKGMYVVKDVSTNGVYLRNGQRLVKNTEVELPKGTEIIIADTNNVFKLN